MGDAAQEVESLPRLQLGSDVKVRNAARAWRCLRAHTRSVAMQAPPGPNSGRHMYTMMHEPVTHALWRRGSPVSSRPCLTHH